jgi:hypothetical protein
LGVCISTSMYMQPFFKRTLQQDQLLIDVFFTMQFQLLSRLVLYCCQRYAIGQLFML